MDDVVDLSLGSEEIDVFVHLWDPADRDYKNRGARGTALASITGRGRTI